MTCTEPNPATLSWLLRHASLDVWHARQNLNNIRQQYRPDKYDRTQAVNNLNDTSMFRHYIARVIRDHTQGETE